MVKEDKKGFIWIVVGDIHDAVQNITRIPECAQADGVIISGDITFNGGTAQAKTVFTEIEKLCPIIFAQIGNMDKSEINTWLSGIGKNLHGQVHELAPNVGIFGIGGSTRTPFATPSEFEEADYAAWLTDAWEDVQKWQHKILISHNPPKDTACDILPNGLHVGCSTLRDFLLKHQIDICICGHIHEARAVDNLGQSIIINPGELSQGGYVVISFKDQKLSAELKVLE